MSRISSDGNMDGIGQWNELDIMRLRRIGRPEVDEGAAVAIDFQCCASKMNLFDFDGAEGKGARRCGAGYIALGIEGKVILDIFSAKQKSLALEIVGEGFW